VEKYGAPRALYTDWKNVYMREPNEAERLSGEAPLTQFGRMCRKLGTKIMAANLPQAKGRVERNHGTQQDRLVQKLRLYGIGSSQEANRYLRQHDLPDHNRRFRREPIGGEDDHRKPPGKRTLNAIFRLEEERTISQDWVVRYRGRLLQIEHESRHAPAAGRVTVSEGRDGSLQGFYRGQEIKWREIAAPAPRPRLPQAREGSCGGGSQETAWSGKGSFLEDMESHPARRGRSGSRRCRGLRKVQTTGISGALYSAFFVFLTKGTFLIC
jgi:hypothetical protein